MLIMLSILVKYILGDSYQVGVPNAACLLPFDKCMNIFCMADFDNFLIFDDIFKIFSFGATPYQFPKHPNVYRVDLINLDLSSIPCLI